MKTINTIYSDIDSLKKFITKNKISKSEHMLLQIFTGVLDKQFIGYLICDIKKLIPHISIIGSTTYGEIIEDEVETNSTILSFSIFENTKVVTHYSYNKDSDYDCAMGLIEKFDKTLTPKVAISFADGLQINGENYLKAFNDYNKDLIVAGGLAGDNATFNGTIVFNEDKILKNGSVIALLYNDDLQVTTEANFGWKSIGKQLTITKAKDNIVYEIDNIKAVDIYKKYLGEEVSSELPSTGIEFPLIIIKDDLYIPRAVLARNSDDSLTFAGNFCVGDKVTFGYGNIENILKGGERVFEKIVSKPTESIFIYSCMARRILMGDSIKNELGALNHLAPLSGFFTYGEFYNNKQSTNNELLNQTMTILSLSEKKTISKKKYPKLWRDKGMANHTLLALSNLISQTSLELETMNNNLESKIENEILKVKERTTALKYNFLHDDLTKLRNRNALLEDLQNRSFSVLYVLDIDNFNNYSDIYGLSGGNVIIKSFASLLKLTLQDLPYEVYYLQSDQFVIRAEDNSCKYSIDILLKNISSFDISLDNQNGSIQVDATIGVSLEKDLAIEKALMALRHAKQYKKTHMIYNENIDTSIASKKTITWKYDIRSAINDNRIVPVFQPIVDAEQNTIKYEVLMRMEKDKDGKSELISPFFFLDIAIKTKQYKYLTKIMAERSFEIMKVHECDFSFNLSFEDIIHKSTISMLKELILKYDIGDRLIFEIVESENIEDYVIVKNFIADFRKLGVRIAIDDFGAGFSNFAHILEIEPDYLKIDGSMIKNIDTSKKSYEFVKSIVGLTKALGIKTIAEFVHSKEIFDTCLELGVDEFQGFYFSEPVVASSITPHSKCSV